jgi:hypothetical protein
MLCGSYSKIWPEPTKSYIGTSANSFNLNDVQFKIKTPFKNVENLLEGAFSIFLEEIKDIFHSSDRKTEEASRSSTTAAYGKEHSSLESRHAPSRRHNLTNVNIFLYVVKTSEVHLSLATDECYNLTMISKPADRGGLCTNSYLIARFNADEHQTIDVRITANSFFGARNGLATLQQLIWFDDEDEALKVVGSANIADCPKFK